MPTPFSVTDSRLATLKNSLDTVDPNAFEDFLKIVNASPKFQQQLNDFLVKGAITANTVSNSPGGQTSQKGEYVNQHNDQNNLDGATINFNIKASDARDGWSLGYSCRREDYATDASGNSNVDTKTYVNGFDSAVKNDVTTTTSTSGQVSATISGTGDSLVYPKSSSYINLACRSERACATSYEINSKSDATQRLAPTRTPRPDAAWAYGCV